MLIQVKGRRFCQSRVVPPVSESLNSGDCYILVTPTQIFNWQGKFSNVIERSRSAEIAASILQKKDLGCKGASRVETIEEEKLGQYSRENRRFWTCLTGGEDVGTVAGAGPAGEDEVSGNVSNWVHQFQFSQIIAILSWWILHTHIPSPDQP